MTGILKLSVAALALAVVTVGCTDGDARPTRTTTPITSLGSSAPVPTTAAGADQAADSSYTSAITDEVVDNPALDDFQEYVTGLVDTAGLPGVSLLVVQHGELVEQEAWGEYTLDTVVPIASGSKWLSAAMIMTLVDDGTLALDEPISTYVPGLKNKVATITLRQLLSFTSGLIDDDEFACTDDPAVTLTECARTILAAGVVHDPGAAFRYGGQHLFVAGAIAEFVTGVPFAQLFRDRIAAPLGMEHTAFVQSGTLGQVEGVTNTKPAAGVVTSMPDYARFLEMIVHDGVAPDGTRILQATTVAEMQKNQTLGTDFVSAAPFREKQQTPYGLGEWLDWTNAAGDAIVLSSDGARGFRPWIDKQTDLYGIYLVHDNGAGYVEGDPSAAADDGGKVHTSGNWVFEMVAEGLGGSLPEVYHPDA